MSKATHNGNCQICGRVQAAIKGQKIADHGYQLAWNSQIGACNGSRLPALQLDRTACDAYSTKLDKDSVKAAAMTVDDITKLRFTVGRHNKEERVFTDAETFDAWRASDEGRREFGWYGSTATWDGQRKVRVDEIHRQARQMADHAKALREMADRVHGTPLPLREIVKRHEWAVGDVVKTEGVEYRIYRVDEQQNYTRAGYRTRRTFILVATDWPQGSGRKLFWSPQMLRNRATLVEAANA